MKRGEIWTVAGGADYAGKPRPAIVLQNDRFDSLVSVTICLLSSAPRRNVHARFIIDPSRDNGLISPSQAMIDKITTLPKSKFGRRIGALHTTDLVRLNRHIVTFLGLAN